VGQRPQGEQIDNPDVAVFAPTEHGWASPLPMQDFKIHRS
jgi:hypothetical protein